MGWLARLLCLPVLRLQGRLGNHLAELWVQPACAFSVGEQPKHGEAAPQHRVSSANSQLMVRLEVPFARRIRLHKSENVPIGIHSVGWRTARRPIAGELHGFSLPVR